MKAPLPENEAARIKALRRYDILDSPPEEAFDDIVMLAAHICETPISLVTLVDSDRQWFKAKVGLDVPETSREDSFCSHTILDPDDICIVPDALADERFANNPLVTADPNIRFYAGVPLVTKDGYALGSLCVIDRVPRELKPEQLAALRALRRDVVVELELRRHVRLLSRAIAERDHAKEELLKAREELEQHVLERTAELRQANIELSALNDIVTACSSSLDLHAILDNVLNVTLEIAGLEGGTICLLSEDNCLHLTAERGASQETIRDLTTHRIKIGDCLCGNCARDLKPLILSDPDAVLKYASREVLRQETILFHAAFPFVAAGKCVGVLCLFTRTERKPSPRSLSLIETITAQVALAIENARLYEETARHAAALKEGVKLRTAELEAKNEELERMNRIFVDRELRMRELKERIAKLEKLIATRERSTPTAP